MTAPTPTATDQALAAERAAWNSYASNQYTQGKTDGASAQSAADQGTITDLQNKIAALEQQSNNNQTSSLSMQFGIDVTNQQESSVSFAQRLTYGRNKAGGSAGPHSKWFDGNNGPQVSVNHLTSSGYGSKPGEEDSVLCFKRLNATDQAYLKSRAAALTQDEYWCYWQEPEDNIKSGKPTVADYDAAYNTLDSIRKGAKGGSHVKLWPCLMNYQEHDVDKAGYDWKAILTPIKNVIDGFGVDFYRSASNAASQTPAVKGAWILDASQTLQKPWATTEFGVQISTKISGDTAQTAAQWMANYFAWAYANDCLWINLWLDGVWDNDTVNAPFYEALKVQNMLLGVSG